MKLLNNIIKIGLIIVLLYFIDNYDLLNKIKNIINGKTTTKETFNSLILPPDKAIKIFIDDQLPIFNLGLTNKGNYMDEMGVYFRRHIFPNQPINTRGSLDNIFKLINNQLDIAFVDEEILFNYINNDNLIKSQFKNRLIDGKLPSINFSVIGVCYHQSFIFITTENTGIVYFEDIKKVKYNVFNDETNERDERNVRIGVLNKYNADFYHLLKLLYYSNIDRTLDVDLVIYENYNKLGNALFTGEVDVIYLTTNKKNKMLFELTKAVNCRYISPKVDIEKYGFNDPLLFGLNNYILPPFMMTNKTAQQLDDLYSNQYQNNNINNNNFNSNSKSKSKLSKSFLKKLKTMFSLDTKFSVHKADKREFKDLLNLLSKYIPAVNSSDDIFNKQTTFYSFNDDIRNSLKTGSIIFLTQNNQNRKQLLKNIDFNNHFLIDLSNNKYFINQLDLKAAKTREEYKVRDTLIKNKFNIIFDKVENLNTSYNNINTVSNLHTYSSRVLLIAKNNLQPRYIEQLTENYIQNLRGLHTNINKYLSFYTKEEKESSDTKNNNNNNTKNYKNTNSSDDEPNELYNAYVDKAFDFNELVSVKNIPIHKYSKKIYEKYGLIKVVSVIETDIV